MRIYLASPLGFSEATRYFYERSLLPMLRDAGFVVLDPWSLTLPESFEQAGRIVDAKERREAFVRLNQKAAAANTAAIEACDVVVAVLDGPDIDSGTAAEIGYAAAYRKRIIGYRNDLRNAGDNEGGIVNLQVEHFIRSHGRGKIVRTAKDLLAALQEI